MTFKDKQLEQHFERTMSLHAGNLPTEERPVFALMAAYGWFRRIDGEQSSRVTEVIELLLLPELRPALRSWYEKFGENSMNPMALEFRERLSKLAGETFGQPVPKP